MSFSNQVFKNKETGQLYDVFKEPQGDLIPTQDSTYDLGSNTKKWDALYTNNIYLGSSTTPLNAYIKYTFGAQINPQTTVTLVRVGNIVNVFMTAFSYTSPIQVPVLDVSDIPPEFHPSSNQTINFSYFGSVTGSTQYLHRGIMALYSGSIWLISLYKNFNSGLNIGDSISTQNISFSYII